MKIKEYLEKNHLIYSWKKNKKGKKQKKTKNQKKASKAKQRKVMKKYWQMKYTTFDE